MNRKTTIFAIFAIASAVALGEDWTYDNGSLTDGDWTFGASKNSVGGVTVGYATGGPDKLTALDFTKPVYDADGNELYFTIISPRIEEVDGAEKYVGELKLPPSGYTEFGYNAFAGCVNATGRVVLSPDLTQLRGGAFIRCGGITIVGSSFPAGLKKIFGDFEGCKIEGVLDLTHVTSIEMNAFRNTDTETVIFGPDLKTVSNANQWNTSGAFMGCASLTNVIFNPNSSASITGGYMFSSCTSLEEIDLTGVSSITQDSDSVGHFKLCSALTKVTFGGNMEYLDGRIFNGASALKKVFFNGPPPATIENEFLYGAGDGEVTTYVVLDENSEEYDYKEAKAAWDALTAGGEINHTDSTWAPDYLGNTSPGIRHLLLYKLSTVSIEAVRDADEEQGVSGLFVVSRAADDISVTELTIDYTVTGSAVGGQTYGVLGGRVTIPAGERSATIVVAPMNDQETTSDSTVVVSLAPGEYLVDNDKSSATVTVVNGESFGGWMFDTGSGTVTKGGWTFNATFRGSDMTIGSAVAWPDATAPLDFSGVVVGDDGSTYVIVNLNPAFGDQDPAVRDLVGTITLPGEGLKTISQNAFHNCTNMNGKLVVPVTVTSIGSGAFGRGDYSSSGMTDLTGDLELLNIQEFCAESFNKTRITSVRFGPSLKQITGGWYRAGFSGCSSLTNIVFDPESKVKMVWGFNFTDCTALKNLDLSCVTNISDGVSDYPETHFTRCTALTNITFGADLRVIPANLFTGATALQSVHFKGAAPVIGTSNGGMFTGVKAGQTVKTFVMSRYANVKNSDGLSWSDYTQGGSIGRRTTRWKSDYLNEDLNNENFPLLRVDGTSFIILVR